MSTTSDLREQDAPARPKATTTGIVVGVDGSPGARAALRWARAEGATRGVPVAAVLAWGFLDQHHPDLGVRWTD
jgi:nucleotide-binding universal stress UspA family protein